MPPSLLIPEWHLSAKRTRLLSTPSCPPFAGTVAFGIALDYSSCGTRISLLSLLLPAERDNGCAGPLIWIRRVAHSLQHSRVTTLGPLTTH
jgi:hypothetical protein